MDVLMIERLAARMRHAIVTVLNERHFDGMPSFPRGACSDASLLLGACLIDHGFHGFEYVEGERGTQMDNTWTSHAWLARDELTVDITADQFDDAPSGVIVSSASVWHSQFKIVRKTCSDFRSYTGCVHYLATIYNLVKPSIFQKDAP